METYTIFSSPIGELLVAGDERAVTHVTHAPDAFIKNNPCMVQAESNSVVAKAACAIHAYLSGEKELSIPYAAKGTEFQQSVWKQLSLIPYGATSSYTEIAERIGKPTAFRAVANACGQNPMPLLIPCHRVVHKSGNVSGFAWGVETKRFLLDLEAMHKAASLAA